MRKGIVLLLPTSIHSLQSPSNSLTDILELLLEWRLLYLNLEGWMRDEGVVVCFGRVELLRSVDCTSYFVLWKWRRIPRCALPGAVWKWCTVCRMWKLVCDWLIWIMFKKELTLTYFKTALLTVHIAVFVCFFNLYTIPEEWLQNKCDHLLSFFNFTPVVSFRMLSRVGMSRSV